jgi:hypothetical protein
LRFSAIGKSPETPGKKIGRKGKIAEFALFTSVLPEDLRPDGDADVMATFMEEADFDPS